MGAWDVFRNLIAGKPGFEAPKQDSWDGDAPTLDYAEERQMKREEAKGLYEGGVKQIPEVAVVRVKYNLSGTNTEVWATVRNMSSRPIELDKINLCGQRKELDYPLQPGGEREFSVYKGPSLTHDSYKNSELYYKDSQTGDYFRADHFVEYHLESNGTYNVNSLELKRPIHDV